ncbi:hypothetical protein HMPREF1548_01363 [Clostridium sp. KLE 1755]|nr:hypothetical protein HMPREF1548_01363 [Clostridium sp. KLE 1755]
MASRHALPQYPIIYAKRRRLLNFFNPTVSFLSSFLMSRTPVYFITIPGCVQY